MAERFFKEKFGNIKKIKVCTTSADIDFDNYTEPGSYEIYEDMGSGQSRVYLLTVDKSVSGACLKQTRIHCGTVDARQTTASGAWTAWAAISGGGGGSADLSNYYTKEEADINFVPTTAYVADQQYFDGWITQNTDDIAELKESVGDIDTALDAILAIQNEFIGGVSE